MKEVDAPPITAEATPSSPINKNCTDTKTEETRTEAVSQPTTSNPVEEFKDFDVREAYGISCRFLGHEFNQISS
jgi:hypothetical protein